jgi:signal transduction histidine kinase
MGKEPSTKLTFLKKIFAFLLLLLLFVGIAGAQSLSPQQLKEKIKLLRQNKDHLTDTTFLNSVISLSLFYADRYPDSALGLLHSMPAQCKAAKYLKGEIDSYNAIGNAWQTKGNFDTSLVYYQDAFRLAEKNNFTESLPGILGNIGLIYLNQGNYPVALQKFYASLHLAEKKGDKLLIRSNLNNIGIIEFYQGKMNEAETAYIKTLTISQQLADTPNIILSYNNIGEVNVEQNQLQKAIGNLSLAYDLARKKNIPNMVAAVSNTLGDCYLRLDSLPLAEKYFMASLQVSQKTDNARAIAKAEMGLAKVNIKKGLPKAALRFGLDAIDLSRKMGQAQLQRDALEVVADIYEQMGDGNNALIYYKQYKKYSDSLVNVENEREASNLKAGYEMAKKDDAFQRKTSEQRWWIFSALAALLSALIIIFIIYRNQKKLSYTYRQLKEKTGIIEEQKKEVEKTLTELKATQKQLVQNEKMASLGQLTAGIAHEIQNPLNFVNNFSELNNELIDELKNEKSKLNNEEQDELLNDIYQNNEKIKLHGSRADSIVKGMLQHSQSSKGEKAPTDINALCDEYIRLSYHGLRAKDKNFNAELKTDFNENIGKINIIPQDIGRVLLNLLNNAFYAVEERVRQTLPDSHYQPIISVATKKTDNKIIITVTDNGNGIPQNIVDKIFQPFFTTKPTGQGTGLGLSLSYDIISANDGEIKVESKEGGGSTFIIQLPIV